MSNIVDFKPLSRSAFIERFTLYVMMSDSNDLIPGFVSIFDYARQAAAIYWDENHVDRRSPEDCAEADMHFWPTDFPSRHAQR